jgi:integral membrane sensor domain MASE1
MRQILKDLMLVVIFVVMFAAIPFALAPDNPLRQPPQPPAGPGVDVPVNVLWGMILLVALGAPVVLALVDMSSHGNMATHTVERVEENHHD